MNSARLVNIPAFVMDTGHGKRSSAPTPYGRLRHLSPVVTMPLTPPRWDVPTSPIGSRPPSWDPATSTA